MATQTAGPGWTSFLTQAADAWLENCGTLSVGSRTIATRWLKSCADQIQSNLDTWTSLARCQDTAEAAAIQQRWWKDAVDRLSAEIKGYQEQLAALSKQGGAAFRETKPARRPPSDPAAAA